LLAILDAGPGAFLGQVDVEPELRGAHFTGWRVTAFPRAAGDERLAGAGIRAGDVIVGVNDRGIERPEQLAALWQLLRKTDEIAVTLRRNGSTVVLRWTVLGGKDTMRP
jgi:type II secretory pathway component PulC